jgi:hypothetical protein
VGVAAPEGVDDAAAAAVGVGSPEAEADGEAAG